MAKELEGEPLLQSEKTPPVTKVDSSYQGTEFHELLAELEGKSPSEIFTKANRAFKDKEYKTATQIYRILNSLYPFNQYAEQAQVYSIQAYYHNQDMDDVIKAVNRFSKLYPTSHYIEAVSYLSAEAFFERLKKGGLTFVDNLFPFLKIDFSQRIDSAQLSEAAYQLSAFLRRFPSGAYQEKAQKKLDEIHKLVVKKEYFTAHFYFKRKNYLAAYNRIISLLERYPQAPHMLEEKYRKTLLSDYQYAKKQLGVDA